MKYFWRKSLKFPLLPLDLLKWLEKKKRLLTKLNQRTTEMGYNEKDVFKFYSCLMKSVRLLPSPNVIVI